MELCRVAKQLNKSPKAVLIALLLIIFPTSVVFAESSSEISVQWYEPKVVPTTKPGINKVTLVGKTDPFVVVQVSSENIVIIQRQDPKGTFQPKVEQKQVRSNGKGDFNLSIFVPSGLLQVPIEFKALEITKPILLTMRVDPKDVSLNVKVIRPVKTKIVKVTPTAQKYLSLGWAPLLLQQSATVDNAGEIKNSESAAMSVRLEGSAKYDMWWWLMHYEYAKGKDSSLQSYSLGARYKLSSSELWLDLEVDGRALPLLTSDATNVPGRVNTQVYRAGLGFTYLKNFESMSISASLFYRVPVAVKVEAGQIVVTSPVAASLYTKVTFPIGKPWSLSLGVNVDYSSFQYEYRNTPMSIDNQGKAQNTIVEGLGLIQYDF